MVPPFPRKINDWNFVNFSRLRVNMFLNVTPSLEEYVFRQYSVVGSLWLRDETFRKRLLDAVSERTHIPRSLNLCQPTSVCQISVSSVPWKNTCNNGVPRRRRTAQPVPLPCLLGHLAAGKDLLTYIVISAVFVFCYEHLAFCLFFLMLISLLAVYASSVTCHRHNNISSFHFFSLVFPMKVAAG